MATLHIQGTKLEEVSEPNILAKPFLWSLGVVFLLAMHFFQPNPVGVPLPLVSYGGTSSVTLLAGFGILMSIHAHRRLLPR